MSDWQIIEGDARSLPLADGSIQCCVTSPPYWGLRDYGVEGQIGLEPTPDEYVATMVGVFREVWRVLRDDGTCWLNLGSSYFGSGKGGGGSYEADGMTTSAGVRVASGGIGPNQSRLDSHAPAYGSDGTELQDSPAAGLSCPCCGGELQDGSLIRRGYTARTSRPNAPSEPPPSPTSRDTALPGSSEASPVSSPRAGRRSTTRASFRRDRAACVPAGAASALPLAASTSPVDAHGFAGTVANMNDKKANDHPSGSRIWGTGFFCTACGYCTTAHPFKPKDLIPTPWMVAMALQSDGWYLRQGIVWQKPNPMPESVTDRCTTAHEFIFLLAKNERYYFDAEAIREGGSGVSGGACFGKQSQDADGTGAQQRRYDRPDYATRNARSVWTIPTQPYPEAHFATYPVELARRCIKAGSREGDVVLDPFSGSGTTGEAAVTLDRRYVGIELNTAYIAMSRDRIGKALKPSTWVSGREIESPLFVGGAV